MLPLLLVALSVANFLIGTAANCPITPTTRIAYSKATGVGGASIIWVEDLLWWVLQHNPEAEYVGLVEEEIQACDLANFKNLRLYINPGGNAYNQARWLLSH
eukprot:SAG11_NODE_279_length_11283_cov_11.461820_9_plen_102_part_00